MTDDTNPRYLIAVRYNEYEVSFHTYVSYDEAIKRHDESAQDGFETWFSIIQSTDRRQSGPMKRFALFTGSTYYPSGGWEDFKASFDTLVDALAAPREDWYHVVDLTTGEIVKAGNNDEEQ
jgi:hypothetical protein